MQWDEFISFDESWILEPGQLEEGLQLLDLDAPVAEVLAASARRIASGGGGVRGEWELLVEWLRSAGSAPAPAGDGVEPLAGALAYLACVPDLFRRQRQRGIDIAVPRDSVVDLQRWILNYHRHKGEWGLSPQVYGWFRKLYQEVTITIGRLQYNSGRFGLAHLMRCRFDGRVVALAKDGLWCDGDGFPCTGGNAFVTVFAADGAVVTGHPFDAGSGAILKDPLALPGDEWEEVVSPDSPVLFIHIPEGPAMTADVCDDSIRRVRDFFPRYYPEIDWKALVCVSWLVDPELLKVTPENSNIASFVRRFVPLTYMNASDNQLWERVFGGRVDPETFTPTSSLQRAIISHVKRGGRFRNCGGYIADSIRT